MGDKRNKAVEMTRNGVPVAEIVKQLRVSRGTVMNWLHTAEIEPIMLRDRSKSTGSLANTPLALSIEEGVRKRLEGKR